MQYMKYSRHIYCNNGLELIMAILFHTKVAKSLFLVIQSKKFKDLSNQNNKMRNITIQHKL